ncbi:MAG: hypothetical protein FJ125_09595 [Deltaproteobacteria bacterium]|nr:hypothetical protein [Deltaproteobacteria bacterium]
MDVVDPFIGTGTYGAGVGSTLPGATVPFGMVTGTGSGSARAVRQRQGQRQRQRECSSILHSYLGVQNPRALGPARSSIPIPIPSPSPGTILPLALAVTLAAGARAARCVRRHAAFGSSPRIDIAPRS